VTLSLPPVEYIRRTRDLRQLVQRLRGVPLLAVDTESNSLYAYYERVCLVQLSTREADYIVDPLAMDDISPLGDLLGDPATEIVFHAAEYDVITLKRDYGFTFVNIFDTMMAARICGWPQTGLGNILVDQFGIVADKRFQRADWSRRPLDADQLRYAQMDTHYLPALRDRLLNELAGLGRLEEGRELFAALPDLPPAGHVFDPDGFWRIQAVRALRPGQIAIARELYLARDDIAQRHDWPPFKVFNDQVLARLATLAPRRPEDLEGLKGISPRLLNQESGVLLEAVARGRKAKPPSPPRRRTPPDPDVQARYDLLHDWRKRRAAERGVESDIIASRETLWALAQRPPVSLADLENVPGLGPWRRATYGAELLDMFKE
jgi:ribonuclease D